jgi:hypothetical protein
MDPQVATLGLKLLETLHLNVLERRSLPTSGIPFSALVAGVASRVAATGWFPISVLGGSEMWIGARVEQRGTELWVHERYETGVGRVGPIRSRRVGSVDEAVRAFIDANGGAPLDGVHVDWGA